MSNKAIPFFLLLLTTSLASAAPAPWYWWISKVDGARVCMQTSPGEGWYRDKAGIAYRNARCVDNKLRRQAS